jgi:hypothetical protein
VSTEREVWIVKYWNSSGVKKIVGKVHDDMRMVEVRENGCTHYYHGKDREWCDSAEAAAIAVEELRQKRLASLQKSFSKTLALVVDIPA